MGAVIYVTLDDVLQNMEFQCDVNIALAPFAAVIEAYRLLNADFLSSELTQDEINEVLKILTGCTAATSTALNCYPRGLDTTLCFDVDGNPVP